MTFTRGYFVKLSQVTKLWGTYIEDMIHIKTFGKLYHKYYGPPMWINT